MSQAVYEQYKDALRRGHVAALRGQVEAALEAYGEAAAIAPERALPHVGIGGLYQRVGRPADALVAFDAALARSARDEAALAGRAEALQALGRPAEAASSLDLLAVAQEAGDRAGEALSTSVLALSLAESRERRATVGRLAERVRVEGPGGPDREALERAERLLGGPVGAPEGAAPTPGAEELEARADAALGVGDESAARTALVAAADAHAAEGRPDAALDACYRALALDPTEPSVHLALVRRYRQRGWDRLAEEKLGLLDRVAELSDDASTRAAIRELAGDPPQAR